MHRGGLVVKRLGFLSKVLRLDLVLGVGVLSPLPIKRAVFLARLKSWGWGSFPGDGPNTVSETLRTRTPLIKGVGVRPLN